MNPCYIKIIQYKERLVKTPTQGLISNMQGKKYIFNITITDRTTLLWVSERDILIHCNFNI